MTCEQNILVYGVVNKRLLTEGKKSKGARVPTASGFQSYDTVPFVLSCPQVSYHNTAPLTVPLCNQPGDA